jgi:hypothetical protein
VVDDGSQIDFKKRGRRFNSSSPPSAITLIKKFFIFDIAFLGFFIVFYCQKV